MGDYGFVCNGCGTAIRDGEDCVLVHIRHGKMLGAVKGHYSGYGGVAEEDALPDNVKFAGEETVQNGHYDIYQSLFGVEDSFIIASEKRFYDGSPVTLERFVKLFLYKDLAACEYRLDQLRWSSCVRRVLKDNQALLTEYRDEYTKFMDTANDQPQIMLRLSWKLSSSEPLMGAILTWSFGNSKIMTFACWTPTLIRSGSIQKTGHISNWHPKSGCLLYFKEILHTMG